MPLAPLDASTTVDYLVAGEAGAWPDVVLVHGTGGTAVSNWSHLLDGLTAGGRRAIAPNLAGSGATIDHGRRLELAELVGQVDGAARHAAASEPFDLVGFSLGAVVAAQLAASHPERVRRLVLIAGWVSSADARSQLQFGLWQRLGAGGDPRAVAELLTLTGFSAGYLAARPRRAVEATIATTMATLPPGFGRQAELDQRIDLTAALPRITAPTLVLGGDQDQMVPAAAHLALAAGIDSARLEPLPSGHLVLYEQPAALLARITGFLEE